MKPYPTLMLEPENPKLAAFDDEARGERDLTPYYYRPSMRSV